MADVTGSWETVVSSPMGEQKSTMNIVQDGDSFTGASTGANGSSEVQDGKIEGDRLTWKMDITIPMPMTLEGDATVDGDTMTGHVKAGAFGNMPLTGKRVS